MKEKRVMLKALLILISFFSINSFSEKSVLIKNNIITIESEGIAFLGSGITEDDAKAIAINDAKRNALEKAGTYLESHTEVLNYKLVKDEIITYTGSLLETKTISSEPSLINKRFAVKVKIIASIDANLLKERIEKVRSDNYLKTQLEEERKRNEALKKKLNEIQYKKVDKEDVKELLNLLSAEELLEKGKRARYKKEYDLAIKYLKKAIEIDPKLISAYYFLSNVYKHQKNDILALDILKKCKKLNPDSSHSYIIIAYHYKAINDNEKALKEYNQAISVQPNNTYAYIQRALFYLKTGKENDAFNDYNKAISINPKDEDIYYHRGNAYFDLGKYEKAFNDHKKAVQLDSTITIYGWDSKARELRMNNQNKEAIRFFNMAIQLNPKDPFNYNERGDIYFELKFIEKAFQDYNMAIKRAPKNSRPYTARGIQYMELKKYSKALTDFNKAISLEPSRGYRYRGNYYMHFANYDKAFSDHKKSVEIDSTEREFISDRWGIEGSILIINENYKLALKVINNAIFFEPNNTSHLSKRGRIYQRLENYDLAFKDYNKAISIEPEDDLHYSWRASLLKELGRYEQAIQDLNMEIEILNKESALSFDKAYFNNKKNIKTEEEKRKIAVKSLSYAYYNRGNLYSDLKQYELALKDFNSAISFKPNDCFEYFERGNAYFKLNKEIKAIMDYTTTLELNPKFTEAYYNRALVYASLGKNQDAVNDFDECARIEKNSELANDARKYIRKLGYKPKY